MPEDIKGEYIPEGVAWSRIGRHYKTRFVNEALRIYYIDQPSMVHGGRVDKNAVGARIYHLMVLNEESEFFWVAPLQLFRSAALYVRASFHTGRSIGRQANDIRGFGGKFLWLCALPVGLAIHSAERWLARWRSAAPNA